MLTRDIAKKSTMPEFPKLIGTLETGLQTSWDFTGLLGTLQTGLNAYLDFIGLLRH